MTKHTPGPWEVWTHSQNKEVCIVTQDAKSTLWTVAITSGDDRDANARLIAAAPDLLAAADGVVILIDQLRRETRKLAGGSECSIGHYAQYHFDVLRAAIARARGEE